MHFVLSVMEGAYIAPSLKLTRSDIMLCTMQNFSCAGEMADSSDGLESSVCPQRGKDQVLQSQTRTAKATEWNNQSLVGGKILWSRSSGSDRDNLLILRSKLHSQRPCKGFWIANDWML